MADGLEAMEELGAFGAAGARALKLALEAARRSSEEGRVPIAGAAVHMDERGELSTVALGRNGRIPEIGTLDLGYPTDHGETAAVRGIEDFAAIDWSRVVFATTLSPCIMCSRTLMDLHGRGLTRLVVAESKTFAGPKKLLAALPGMTTVELEDAECVERMQTFARRYPWDWAADVGEVPPADLGFVDRFFDEAPRGDWLARVAEVGAGRPAAMLLDSMSIPGSARDERSDAGGNPTRSAPMLALGRAGSAVNVRECILLYSAGNGDGPLSIESFGVASLGACELFRPAALLTDRAPAPDLAGALETAGIKVVIP